MAWTVALPLASTFGSSASAWPAPTSPARRGSSESASTTMRTSGRTGRSARTTRAPCGPPAPASSSTAAGRSRSTATSRSPREPVTAGTVKPPAVRSRACRPSATRRCSLKTTTPVRPGAGHRRVLCHGRAHDPSPHCVASARTSTGSGASPRTQGPSATAWAGAPQPVMPGGAPRRLAHEDLAGRGLGGEPRREVDGEAEPVALVPDGGAGVDADPGPERRSGLRDGDAEADAVGGDRRAQQDAVAHRLHELSAVLVGQAARRRPAARSRPGPRVRRPTVR